MEILKEDADDGNDIIEETEPDFSNVSIEELLLNYVTKNISLIIKGN